MASDPTAAGRPETGSHGGPVVLTDIEGTTTDIATLASAFLATSPPRARRVVDLRTPTKPVFAHRVIHKRSVPFVNLVRKLVQ